MSRQRRGGQQWCEACAIAAAASPATTTRPRVYPASVLVARGVDEALAVVSTALDGPASHITLERAGVGEGALVFVRLSSRFGEDD